MRPITPHTAFVCVLLASIGCAGKGMDDPTGPAPSCGASRPFSPTLTCIQQVVFTPTCAVSGCHLNPGAQLNQDLSEGSAWSSIVGIPSAEIPSLNRVTAGDPDNSYLIMKLEGDPAILGDRMPLGGPYLSQAEIDVIRQWILDGALEN